MSFARRVSVSALALSFLLVSCSSEELTELVVVVDSDLAVPSALDEISILVEGPSGIPKTARAMLGGADAESLPVTIGLRPSTPGNQPVTIRAHGFLAGTRRVSAGVLTSFIEGQRLVVRIVLRSACVDVICELSETCSPTGICVPADVDPFTLAPFTGVLPGSDMGPTDAGARDLGDLGGPVDLGPADGAPAPCTATTCDDDIACTIDACGPRGCTHTPDDSVCDDSIACTTNVCDVRGGCAYVPDDSACGDGNPCRVYTCTASGCSDVSRDDYSACIVAPDPGYPQCGYCQSGACTVGSECVAPCTCDYRTTAVPLCRDTGGSACAV